MFVDPTKNFPGPGAYSGTGLIGNKTGSYFNSRYKSPGNAVISRSG